MSDALSTAPASEWDLIGRSAETAVVDAFLERASESGAALLITGEPGVGKTALLNRAERHAVADGAAVVRAEGVEFEAEVSFAGLNQLLVPLLGHLEALPDPHQEALTVALGLGAGPPPHRLLVSAAVLGLLTRAAETGPVLVVVDDLPWVDPSSVRVLGFVARRLKGRRIGLLAAARAGSDCLLLHAGLPQLQVSALDGESASALLQERFPGLAPGTRQRVLTSSVGNPLALLELPALLSTGQRSGSEALPGALPLSSHLQRAFAQQLASLPSSTRRLLLLAALEGTGDLRTLRAAAGDDSWLDGLAPAEVARLVRVDLVTQRVTLHHPLIASAAVELSTSGELRRAHQALAEALVDRPEECAWHLAAAALGPDSRAADLLEVAALHARRKGDTVRAVRALLQSAHLSPAGRDRARRLAAAAFVGADATGELRSVPDLLDEAGTADPAGPQSLDVAVAAAHHLLNDMGDVETAHLMLVGAVEHALAHGATADHVADALHSLLLVCHFGGRDELWRPFERALDGLGPNAPAVLSASRTVFADPVRATPEGLERLDQLVTSANSAMDPTYVVRVGIAAFYADRLTSCRHALLSVVRDGKEGGAAGSALQALMMLCHDALDAGRWDEAARTAKEGIAWGESLGYRLVTQPGVYCLALIAAAQGDDSTAHSLADDLLAWSAPRGVHLFADFAHRIRGLAALGQSDFEEAFRQANAVSPAGGFAPYAPVAACVALDLVEAAVRTGRRAEAAAHVAAMRRSALFAGRPRFALVRAGSEALLARDDDAEELFERALAVPAAERHPFERARILLAYGEHLRRQRATARSRARLASALDIFQALGAVRWAERADGELRAAGATPRVPVAEWGAAALTPQEHQIAMLAAAGLSNKQIGRRLYLSPRTVGAHLYHVFPKLGITSRAALRDALSKAPGAADPSSGTPGESRRGDSRSFD